MHRPALVVSLALFGGTAHAAPSDLYLTEVARGTDDSGPRTRFARQAVVTPPAASPLAKSRTIYLNRNGAMLTQGPNDSYANTSSVVSRPTLVPSWEVSEDDWADTVDCMRDMWARFDVVVTEVDPGASPHIEAIFTRSAADVGISENVGGISPFSTTCSVVEKSIVFAFTENLPKRPQAVCEVMSQEVAHSYGLDHELVASDPLTYLSYAGKRTFQDQDAQCGESTPRNCGFGATACRPSQNSYRLLLERLGESGRDNTPPAVGITSPADRATVDAGFMISATASDNIAVKTVEFYIDGKLVATKNQPPYQLETDPALESGAHTIVVEATDGDGNTAMQERDVMITDGAGMGLACSTGGGAPLGSLAPLGLALAAVIRRRRAR